MPSGRSFRLTDLLFLVLGLGLMGCIWMPPACQPQGAPAAAGPRMKAMGQASGIVKKLMQLSEANPPTFAFPTGSTSDRFYTIITHMPDPMDPKLILNPIDPQFNAYFSGGRQSFTGRNYSFALLNDQNVEWGNYHNASAPLVSDRLLASGGSVWKPNGSWEGVVAWGDAHVSYETSRSMFTIIGCNIFSGDDIFSAADGGAEMVYP